MADIRAKGDVNERPEDRLQCLFLADRGEVTLIVGKLGSINPLQEGAFMTHEELHASEEYMWRALFAEQRMALTLAVEMLLRCHLSPQQILTKTMRALEGSQHDS
jgi:hypothetical protein